MGRIKKIPGLGINLSKKNKKYSQNLKNYMKNYNKLYYSNHIKPKRIQKQAKFLLRGVCGLCGMTFRPNNLFKPQSLKFKTVTFGGRGRIMWFNYDVSNLPKKEYLKIRLAILKNIKNILLSLNLTDLEKEGLSTLLNLKTPIYEETIKPTYSIVSKPTYSSKLTPTFVHAQKTKFSQVQKPVYEKC